MELIDARTLMLVLSAGNLLLALLRLAFDPAGPAARRSRIWAAAKLLQGASFLLFALRDQTSSVLILPVANSLLFAGFAAEFVAAQRQLGLRAGWNSVVGAVALLLVGLWVGFLSGAGNAERQTVLASMGIIVFGGTGAAFATRWSRTTALGRVFGASYLYLPRSAPCA